MKIKLLLLLFAVTLLISAQDESQTFLSLKQTGVEEFLNKHPEYDGRGTIVFILDSGVDMGIDGLKLTSTGEKKVIDAVDFSRQGYVKFYKAETEEDDDVEYFVNEEHGYKVKGVAKLSLKPLDDEYYIGCLDEKLFLNSSARKPDINDNGNKDDKFYFVTFETKIENENHWVVYLDKNADGDLSDETPLRNYREKLQEFYIERPSGVPYLTFALNIYPERNIVSFFFDDNSHGTHCAGISTGYKIGGADFNGVAPGANVIGLKIGNNEFSGGATVTGSMKSAYLYADSLSRVLESPCVINMSYGVGSVIETYAEMENILDNLAKNNPYLYICKSAGNDGPGISTIGQPSASRMSITSGAVLTKEVAADMYGVKHDNDYIYAFSARGGEIDKPDIVSPGGCFSTIPNFARWDGMQGTSMASPYTTGVVALLMSGAKQKYPDLKIPSYLILKSLKAGAQPMPGYSYLDQGAGLINVDKAWDALEKFIAEGEVENMETYTVKGFCPNLPNDEGAAIYIRNGSFLTGKESFRYTVTRNNTIKKDKFYRVYNLKSDSDWLKPTQKRTHIRNDQKDYVDVEFDKSKMTEPGVYNGKIFATRQGTNIPEFDLMATVVIPYQFNLDNNYRLNWKDKKLDVMATDRYFINIPAGATSLKINLKVEENEYGKVRYYLFNPDGREVKYSKLIDSDTEEESITDFINDIYPGVWELDVVNHRTSENPSEYNLSVEFDGINRIGDYAITKNHNTVDLSNEFNKVKKYYVTADISGYVKTYVKMIRGKTNIEIPFKMTPDMSKKTFEISLSKEDFNKNTDFAFLIYDGTGKKVSSGGLTYQDGDISIDYKEGYDKEEFVLKIVPGFVYEKSEAAVHITEKTFFDNSVSVKTSDDGSSTIEFYPSVVEHVNLDFSKMEKDYPGDTSLFGNMYFQSYDNNYIEYKLPLKFKLQGE